MADFNVAGEFEGEIDLWCTHWRQVLQDEGVQIIEGLEHTADGPSVKVLPEDFVTLCRTTGQKFAVLLRHACDIDETISEYVDEEVADDEDDLEKLIAAFRRECAETLVQAQRECAVHAVAQFFIWHQGGTLTTRARSASMERLMTAMVQFCEKIDDQRRNTDRLELEAVGKNIQDLERTLKEDPAFMAIKGKRKRCVYVESKYGELFGPTERMRRPDAYGNLMNAKIVELVERISDELLIQHL